MTRTICQAVDDLGNIVLLKDDGLLEKRDPLNALLWSKQVEQSPTVGTTIYANQATLDIDGNVWLSYDDELNTTVRDGSTGDLSSEILGTATNVLVAGAGGTRIFAFSTSRGILHEIEKDTKAVIRSFDLTDLVEGYQVGGFVNQIASSSARDVYIPAITSSDGIQSAAVLVKLDTAGDGTIECISIGSPTIHHVASADNSGKVYVGDVYGNIYRYDESTQAFDFYFNVPGATGVINLLTFTDDNDLVVVDDGTFNSVGGSSRIVDADTGELLSTTASSNVGTVCGDILGYHHIYLTRIDVAPSLIAPSFNVAKLTAHVTADGTIVATGKPGAVANADTVEFELDVGPTLIGAVAPNADGSFSVSSSPGAGVPGGQPVTFRAKKGAQEVEEAAASTPITLPANISVEYQTPFGVFTGVEVRLKAKILDGSGDVVPASGTTQPIFRLRLDSSSTFFNTSTFVLDNGNYIIPSYDTLTEVWFADVTIPAAFSGSATLFIVGSSHSTGLYISGVCASQATLDEVKTAVDEMNSKVDIAFGAPAGSFTDATTIGGFIFEKLVDIQRSTRRTLAGIIGTRNVCVESILVDVSAQSTPKGSTPSIDITVYDENRRFPLDISGSDVYFKAKANLESDILVIDQKAVIVSGSDGMAQAKLAASDTATPGRLVAQIVAEIPGVGLLVSPSFFFDIEESVL